MLGSGDEEDKVNAMPSSLRRGGGCGRRQKDWERATLVDDGEGLRVTGCSGLGVVEEGRGRGSRFWALA
jgi:hypothetical protein